MSSKSIGYFVSRPLLLSILLMMLIFPAQMSRSGFGEESESPSPTISIEFDEMVKQVRSSQTEDMTISFNVTVSFQFPSSVPTNSTVEVNLKTKASWWNITDPPEILFDLGNNRTTFKTEIMVPPNSSADVDIPFEVWGSWRYGTEETGEGIKKVHALIDVLPFYDMFLGSNEPIQYCKVGDWVKFQFNITNRANFDANLSLDFKGDKSVIEHEIEVEKIHLSKGETVTLNLSVRQKPSASRTNKLHLIASFDDDPDEVGYNLDLEMRTEPTLSTFFYERNFIFLISVIAVISLVAASLFIFEKTKGSKDEDPELMDEIEESSIK